MSLEELKKRKALRLEAVVCGDGKVLMARHVSSDGDIWCIPGGAQERGETPEEGALRELREEAGVEGRIVRQLGLGLSGEGRIDSIAFLVDIGNQEPILGHDPELHPDDAVLADLRFLSLREIPERDRAFLWRAGLLSVPAFLHEVSGWGDATSYPGIT